VPWKLTLLFFVVNTKVHVSVLLLVLAPLPMTRVPLPAIVTVSSASPAVTEENADGVKVKAVLS